MNRSAKNVTKKVLCLVIALMLFSTNSSVIADALGGRFGSTATNCPAWTDDWHDEFEIAESIGVPLVFYDFTRPESFLSLQSEQNEVAAFCDEYHVTEIHGSVDINDFPFTDESWLEDSELQAVRDEVFLVCHGVSSYDMPYDPVVDPMLYMFEFECTEGTSGVNFYDLPLVSEYDTFRASGLSFEAFQALVASGMWYCVVLDIWIESVCFHDLSTIAEVWLEHEAVLPFYVYAPVPMSASLPSLTLSVGTIETNAVTLTGTITDTGGATITERGFWIRRTDESSAREVLVSTTSNTFTDRITGLTQNSTHHARAIA